MIPTFNDKITDDLAVSLIGSLIAQRGAAAASPCYIMDVGDSSDFESIK